MDIITTLDWLLWCPSSTELHILILTSCLRCELSYPPSLRSQHFDFAIPAGRRPTEAASEHQSHPRAFIGNRTAVLIRVETFMCWDFSMHVRASTCRCEQWLFLSVFASNWSVEAGEWTGICALSNKPWGDFWLGISHSAHLKDPGKTHIDFYSFLNWLRSIDVKGHWSLTGWGGEGSLLTMCVLRCTELYRLLYPTCLSVSS